MSLLTASCAAGALLVGCSVQESTRSGGLIAPVNTPAPAETTEPPPTLVTVAATDDLSVVASDLAADGEDDDHHLVSVASAVASSVVSSQVEPTTSTEKEQVSAGHEVLASAEPPDGFGEGVLTVESAAGTQTWPVVIADTARARQQGLMGVADFGALGGYAAMVFVFDFDTSGAFWMRDTPLPLRITFVTAEGAVVSGADMTPCLAPTPSSDCERYHPDGPYRIAIEHPLDPAFDIGLAAAERIELAPHSADE